MDDIRNIMLRSFDDELSIQDREILDDALLSSDELRKEYDEYLQMRELLSDTQFKFSKNFSQNVVEAIKKQRFDLYGSFKMIAFSSAAAILILFLSVYVMDGSINLDSLFGLHGYSVEDEFYSFLIN